MNMKELLAYSAEQKKLKAKKYLKERGENTIQGFTQKEFEQSMKLQTSKVKSRTRRTFARGARWNANNLPRIKQDIL